MDFQKENESLSIYLNRAHHVFLSEDGSIKTDETPEFNDEPKRNPEESIRKDYKRRGSNILTQTP